MDPVRPPCGKSAYNHASVDWPAGSSCTPSGDGHRADPVQKQVPGRPTMQKGID